MSNDEQAENIFNQGMALVKKTDYASANKTDYESILIKFKTALGLVERNTQLREKINWAIGKLEIAVEAMEKRDYYRSVEEQLERAKRKLGGGY